MPGAFLHRDFRLFCGGQVVSLIGTWVQSVGQSWLVLELLRQHRECSGKVTDACQSGVLVSRWR